ncbi:DUF417 family protein [Acetobacter orientalis]|uniref:DUF417 family protein n=1 Tax=Acetobacter orientalis TaxID=146474 RepID=UPI0039E734E8
MVRLGRIIVLAAFGLYKWFAFEAQALQHLTQGTWLGLLYSPFGAQDSTYTRAIIENITLITLILSYVNAQIGIIGDSLVLLTGLVTLSLLPQLGRLNSLHCKRCAVTQQWACFTKI